MINNFDQSVDNARMIEWSYSADFTFLKSALETGADVNCLDPQTSDSPLMIACRNGYIDIIHLCLAFGAKNDPHPDFGQTALHAAVSEGQLVAAATVLETADVSGAASIICNLSDSNGQTPLHVASTLGAVDIVELLLRYGADISSIDIHGQTSLHICGGSGNKACLAMLLDHGGDDILESLDHNGNSVLHHASFNGHIECVRLLLETAANVTARNKKGQTAYHLARSKGHDQIILLLTEYNGHVPLVTSSPRYFQHQLQPSNITSTSLKVSPGNFVDQSIPFTPERIFQYSQHQRHFSDSDALSPHQTIQGAQNINHSYMNMALPRPHTLSSPVVSISSARVRYSQSTPTLSQSSWSVVAPRVIDNSSSQSEPTTPDSNGFITAVNSEIKPGSALNNSSSHVMSSQMEVVAPIVAAIAIVPERKSTTTFSRSAPIILTGEDSVPTEGIQVFTKHKIINHKVVPDAVSLFASDSSSVRDSPMFGSWTKCERKEGDVSRLASDISQVIRGADFSTPTRICGEKLDSFHSPSSVRDSSQEGDIGEFADPLEVFDAVDLRWSVYETDEGHTYYLDAVNGHSQWEDPRDYGWVDSSTSSGDGGLHEWDDGMTWHQLPPKSPSPKTFEKMHGFGFGLSRDSHDHELRRDVILMPPKIDWDGELSATDDHDDVFSSIRKNDSTATDPVLVSLPLCPAQESVTSILPPVPPAASTASMSSQTKSRTNGNNKPLTDFDEKVRSLHAKNRFSLVDDIAKDSDILPPSREFCQSLSSNGAISVASETNKLMLGSDSSRIDLYLDVIRGGGSLQMLRDKMELNGEQQSFILSLYSMADEIQLELLTENRPAVDEQACIAVEIFSKDTISSVCETLQSLKNDEVLAKYSRMAGMGIPPQNVLAKMKLDEVSLTNRNRLMSVLGVELELDSDVLCRNTLAKRTSANSMQTLHWKALSPTKLKNSIWSYNEVENGGVADTASSLIADFEMKELEKLFAVVPSGQNVSVSATVKGSVHVTKASDQLKVLERKRAQNIDIGLVAFKVCGSHLDLLKAVCCLDTLGDRLSADHLENFSKLLPTDAEMKRIHNISGSQHPAEIFMQAALMFYPELPLRLTCFITCLNFEGNCGMVSTKMMKIINCCNQVLSSCRLAKLLKKILAVGNAMNQGTTRGGASGFTLDSLLKMIETKGVDKRTSVLDYVVKSLFDRGEEHLLEVIDDLQLVDEGAKLSAVESLREFDTVEKHLAGLSEEFQRNQKTTDGHVLNSPTAKLIVSQFHTRLQEYLRKFEGGVHQLRKRREILTRKMADILEYFAEQRGDSNDDSIKIFIVLQKFRNALMMCKECIEWKLQRGQQN